VNLNSPLEIRVGTHVVLQVVTLRETLLANVAFESVVSRVSLQMLLQLGAFREAPATVVTLAWVVPGVHDVVPLQPTFIPERLRKPNIT
jgi:hypothetical protein